MDTKLDEQRFELTGKVDLCDDQLLIVKDNSSESLDNFEIELFGEISVESIYHVKPKEALVLKVGTELSLSICQGDATEGLPLGYYLYLLNTRDGAFNAARPYHGDTVSHLEMYQFVDIRVMKNSTFTRTDSLCCFLKLADEEECEKFE